MKSDYKNDGLLHGPLPSLNDQEGEKIPEGLPPIIDAHVHLFPDQLFEAIWGWFSTHGWPIRYRLCSEDVLEFLFSRGISRIIGLQYAHRPGVARHLNSYMAGLCRKERRLTGLATVYPGEERASDILKEAFDQGLSGVKLHAHVQCFDPTSPEMRPIYEICLLENKPMVMHVGREPKSPAYECDPHELCDAERVRKVLQEFPNLKICVPHLGADEFIEYRNMLEEFDNLWIDTTMALAEYLPFENPVPIQDFRVDRIIFGTDFPNIPYAWDRELKKLLNLGLERDHLSCILSRNAREFFNISERD